MIDFVYIDTLLHSAGYSDGILSIAFTSGLGMFWAKK